MMESKNPYRAPASGSTHEEGDTALPLSRWRLFFWSVTYFYPLMATACLYSCWLVANVCLGHMPQAYVDDPKYIGGVMDFVYQLSIISLLSLPALTPICFASSFFCPLRVFRDWIPQAVMFASAYIMVAVGIFVLLRLDPGHVVEWVMD